MFLLQLLLLFCFFVRDVAAVTVYMHCSLRKSYKLTAVPNVCSDCTTWQKGPTDQKRVQMDKKMKILNDKMSQQNRIPLPAPHSFFCWATCISWQVLRTARVSYDSWTTNISRHISMLSWCRSGPPFTVTVVFISFAFLCLCLVFPLLLLIPEFVL
jgi:hypothetical protein